MKTKVSFWLIPSEEDRAFFQRIIDTLSQEYDAPGFTPHVTIYSGEFAPDESAASLIGKATQGVEPFSLKIDKLLYSDEFTKTLFVQFQPSVILSKISEIIRSNSRKPSSFVLNPHLSLIYKQMDEATKKKLTTSLPLTGSEVVFNEVKAIFTPEKVQSRADVESWKVICASKL